MQQQLQSFVTKEEVIDFLASHVNWFNHTFLESLSKAFSLAIESYQSYFASFKELTSREFVWSIPYMVNSCKYFSHFRVDLSQAKCEISIKVVISLKAQISLFLGLSLDAIDFCSHDSNALVFSAPFTIVEEFLSRKETLAFDGEKLLFQKVGAIRL